MRPAAAAFILALLSVCCRSEDHSLRTVAAEPTTDAGVLTGCSAPTTQLLVEIREDAATRESLRYFDRPIRDAVRQRSIGYVSGTAFAPTGGDTSIFRIAVQTADPKRSLPLLQQLLRELKVPQFSRIEQNVGAAAAHYYVWPEDEPPRPP